MGRPQGLAGWLGVCAACGVWPPAWHFIHPSAQPNASPQPPAPPAATPAAERPAVDFPHPLITEVLYAVPTGEAGDANGDGSRHVTGDEFIELVNPHDKPIQLKGYCLTDRTGSQRDGPGREGKGASRGGAAQGIRFVFPSLELPSGGVAVVFNGNGQKWTGPVGDASRAPEAGNEKFHSAWVFTMKAASQRVALSNTGDLVLLSDPAGSPVQCVWWGKVDEKDRPGPPAAGQGPHESRVLVEEAPAVSGGSVERTGLGARGDFRAHVRTGDVLFTPGLAPGADARVPGPGPAPATKDNPGPAVVPQRK